MFGIEMPETIIQVISVFISVAIFFFWYLMLVDCLKNQALQGTEKIAWLLVIVVLTWLGALIYLSVRSRKRTQPVETLPNRNL